MRKKVVAVAAFLGLLLFVGLAIKLAFNSAKGSYSCRTHWKDSGFDYRYKIGVGCMLKVEKGWIPSESFRVE